MTAPQPEIERRIKKPLPIDTLLNTGANFDQIADFVGDGRNVDDAGGQIDVWNDQENMWLPVPVGHYVVRSTLGEFYPMSEQAYRATTESAPEATGKTMGHLLHELLQERAVAESGIPAGHFAGWGELLPQQRDRMDGIARRLLAGHCGRLDRALSIAAREVAAETNADPEVLRTAWLADAQTTGPA